MADSQTTSVATAGPALFTHDGYRLYVFDGEPMMMDLDIGKRIGRKRAREIRALIKDNLEDLEFYGLVRLVTAPIPQGGPRRDQGPHRGADRGGEGTGPPGRHLQALGPARAPQGHRRVAVLLAQPRKRVDAGRGTAEGGRHDRRKRRHRTCRTRRHPQRHAGEQAPRHGPRDEGAAVAPRPRPPVPARLRQAAGQARHRAPQAPPRDLRARLCRLRWARITTRCSQARAPEHLGRRLLRRPAPRTIPPTRRPSEIPIAHGPGRRFLPWRLFGRRPSAHSEPARTGRHPKPFTQSDVGALPISRHTD